MIGQVVNNFQIVRKLGAGGMGTVYEGLDLALERRVAVKVLNPELGRDEGFSERFQKEARALARLNHPNVTSIYAFFRHDDQLFLVMELIDGERLDELVRRRGALPWPEAVGVALEFLAGLEHAHAQGIVHRDVKPSNCLVTREGRVKVTDFGIAHVAGHTRLTRTGDLIGTIEYMAPELIAGGEPDGRADLYSLAAVLYELVTGKMPFTGSTLPELLHAQLEKSPAPPRTLAPELPVWLEAAILRGLTKKPDERFQTAREMAAALTPESSAPTSDFAETVFMPPSAPPFESPSAPAPRSRWWLGAGLAGLVVAALAGGAGVYFFLSRPEPRPDLVASGLREAAGAPSAPALAEGPETAREPQPATEPAAEPPAAEPATPEPPAPEPAAAAPVADGPVLERLEQLAEQLRLGSVRLADSYETSCEAAGRDPDAGSGEAFVDQLAELEDAAEELRDASETATRRERAARANPRPGPGRRFATKMRGLVRSGVDVREPVRRRAQELVQIGRQLTTTRAQVDLEPPARPDWKTVAALLERIERTLPDLDEE